MPNNCLRPFRSPSRWLYQYRKSIWRCFLQRLQFVQRKSKIGNEQICTNVVFSVYSWMLVYKTYLACHIAVQPTNYAHTLRWRHNGRVGVSNHQPNDCLLKRLFRRRSKKTPKLRVTGLCAGNSPATSEFPPQMASNAENVDVIMISCFVGYCCVK